MSILSWVSAAVTACAAAVSVYFAVKASGHAKRAAAIRQAAAMRRFRR